MKLNIGGMERKEGWKIMNIQTGGEAGFSPNKDEIDFIVEGIRSSILELEKI